MRTMTIYALPVKNNDWKEEKYVLAPAKWCLEEIRWTNNNCRLLDYDWRGKVFFLCQLPYGEGMRLTHKEKEFGREEIDLLKP